MVEVLDSSALGPGFEFPLSQWSAKRGSGDAPGVGVDADSGGLL